MSFRQLAFNNVFRNKRTYAAYFLSSAFSVMIFFVYSIIAYHPDMKGGLIHQVAVTAMNSAQWIVYVFSFFFILYSVSAFLKTRQHEFGVLIIQGMSHRQLNRLIFLENLLIGFASILAGVGAGLLFAKLGLLVGGNMMDVQLPYYIAPRAVILTVVSFSILFIVISLMTQFMVNKSKVIQLLQGTNKPKKEPKASIWLSLLSALLLGGGYTLAATATAATIGMLMIPVIMMTIIGTYFLFSQLSVFIINLLKRNDHFFLRRTNIITISDLAYRMKDNARMFFMVCIVSTVAFCAVGTLASFGVMDKEMELNMPFPISYSALDENPEALKQLQSIEAQFKEKNISYTKTLTPFLVDQSKQSGSAVRIVSESEFNKIAQLLKMDTLELQGEEAKLLPDNIAQSQYLDNANKTITLEKSGVTVSAHGRTDGPVFTQGMMYNGIVVSDEMYAKIASQADAWTLSGFQMEDWEDTKDIGSDVDKALMEAREAYYSNRDKAKEPQFDFSSLAGSNAEMKQMYSIMLFSALLVGAVFFIAAGSFLYFRLYTDLEQDKEHYRAIGKIGLKDSELSRIATSQLLLLFFVPIVVAIIHSIFAFTALQSLMNLSIAGQTFKVLAGFTVAQILYFLLIRWRYMSHLRQAVR